MITYRIGSLKPCPDGVAIVYLFDVEDVRAASPIAMVYAADLLRRDWSEAADWFCRGLGCEDYDAGELMLALAVAADECEELGLVATPAVCLDDLPF
jgi:hypothetical protein